MKNLWSNLLSYLEQVKPALLAYLKKQSVKAVLKKLAISGGIKGWLIAFVVGELIEKADDKLIEPIFLKLGFKVEVKNGEKIYRKITAAENVDDWRDASNDV